MFKSNFTTRPRFYQVLRLRLPRRLPMRLLNWGNKMPSTKDYNLVPNDDYDTRIPLHPDEAFEYGISFQAKYIGTMDVPRPTSRVEIVAAMRRVRYEFKAKGVKKRKVTVDVSTEGVRVTTRKKNSKPKIKAASRFFGGGGSNNTVTEIMHHPIYRIFYVSHDSSDLKIFSYIARDGPTNVFKCNVFKSNKKSQAMRIVRTVGQAFEVCHKLSNSQEQIQASTSSAVDDAAPSDRASEAAASKEAVSEMGTSSGAGTSKAALESDAIVVKDNPQPKPKLQLELLPPPPKTDRKRSPQRVTSSPSPAEEPTRVAEATGPALPAADAGTPLSAQHQLQLLRERLEQQAQQTQAAVAQLHLLRDQLAAEQAARCEAQARTHQLLVHNKELLEHIASLVSHLQDRERGTARAVINAQQLALLPQIPAGGTMQALDKILKNEVYSTDINRPSNNTDVFNIMSETNEVTQNIENNNVLFSPFTSTTSIFDTAPTANSPNTPVTFEGMTNEQIQNYLINKINNMEIASSATEKAVFNNNQQFFQNSKAFPNIPLLTSHHSDMDLSSVQNHNASSTPRNGRSVDDLDSVQGAHCLIDLNQSQNSLFSSSTADSSKDSTPDAFSSDEDASFIMPLSHNATLKATGQDGRVRLIVPVSPSGSVSNVVQLHAAPQDPSGHTLRVPCANDRVLTTAAPVITRTTSEKVPNRSEMMAAMRAQWTRHTTK